MLNLIWSSNQKMRAQARSTSPCSTMTKTMVSRRRNPRSSNSRSNRRRSKRWRPIKYSRTSASSSSAHRRSTLITTSVSSRTSTCALCAQTMRKSMVDASQRRVICTTAPVRRRLAFMTPKIPTTGRRNRRLMLRISHGRSQTWMYRRMNSS